MESDRSDKRLGESAAREILGPNPFVGFRGEDILGSAGALARQAANQPTLVLEAQAGLVRDIAAVLSGNSKLKADPKDKRFQDAAWSENPFYKVYLGGYLAWTKSLDTFFEGASFEGKTKEQARFVTQLISDALAPSNT